VDVKTRKGSQDDLMILDIDIKERSTGSFSMGVGYSTFDKALAIFRYPRIIFLGEARNWLPRPSQRQDHGVRYQLYGTMAL